MSKHNNDRVDQIDTVRYEIMKIKARLQGPRNFDNVHCISCNEVLSWTRLSVYAYRCLECQQSVEKPLVRIYEF